MKVSQQIFSQLKRHFDNGFLNPIDMFEQEKPIDMRRDIKVQNFIKEMTPELLDSIDVLTGISMYFSNIKIYLVNGGYLLISFVNGILTFEKNINGKKFLLETSFVCISYIIEHNRQALIRRGMPERTNGLILLNTQTQ